MMAGLEMLTETRHRELLIDIFDAKTGFVPHILESGKTPAAVVYYYPERSCVVFASPVIAAAGNQYNMADAEHTYEEAIAAIQLVVGNIDLSQYHLVIPVIGMGATEKHIVTTYKAPGARAPVIFDSKNSNPQRFLAADPDMRLLPRMRNALTGMISSFAPRVSEGEVPGEGRLAGASYRSLGIQSYLDPTSCGYHTSNVMSTIADDIVSYREINVDGILLNVNNNPKVELESPFDSAWRETFIDPAIMGKPDGKAKYNPMHYFYGEPLEKGPKRVLYYGSGAFLLTPMINVLKIPTEYAAKVLVNSALYMKDRLMLWSPQSVPAQYARSAALVLANGLYYGLDSAHMLLRTVTSPINSFKAGWNKHWSLGLLSAATSVAGYTALALFALPFAGVAGASSLVTAIGTPIVNALAGTGLSLGAAGVTTGVLLVGGLTVARAIKGFMNWAMDSYSAPRAEERPVLSDSGFDSGSDDDDFAVLGSKNGKDLDPTKAHDVNSEPEWSQGEAALVDPFAQGAVAGPLFQPAAASPSVPETNPEQQPTSSANTSQGSH